MIPVFPTAYFGSILYFKNLVQHESVFIETKEHFPKQSHRNRCDIVSGDGILSLSIPVKKDSGSKTPTDEVRLSNDENWRARHWRAIVSAYQSSPYFDYYGMEVEEILLGNQKHLLELNNQITQKVIEWLDLETEIKHTEAFAPIIENDPREILVSKNLNNAPEKAPYIQVFPGDNNFTPNLSILDAIMCQGPMARKLLID